MKRFTSLLKDSETKSSIRAVTMENSIKCDGNDSFYSIFFNMEKWWLAAANVGKKRGPYVFISESEGIKSLFIFTSGKKASDFAKDNKIWTNENGEYVIVKKPISIITSICGYRKLGIKKIIIDLYRKIDVEQFKKMYFLYVKDYNIKGLINDANSEASAIRIGELWMVVFNLPAWYFIGNIEKGIVYGNTINSDKIIFLFLTCREAIRTVNEINRREMYIHYEIYKYKPEEGYEFLRFMQNQAAVKGLVLRDKGIYSGTTIENVVRVKEIFEI